jgi:hypothetical protein
MTTRHMKTSTANLRNVVYIEYTSGNEQCPVLYWYNKLLISEKQQVLSTSL